MPAFRRDILHAHEGRKYRLAEVCRCYGVRRWLITGKTEDLPWRRRQHPPPKRRLPLNTLHNTTTHLTFLYWENLKYLSATGVLTHYVTGKKYWGRTYLVRSTRVVHRGKKVKCTLVQALRLCRGRKAHRGSKVIALLFLDHGTRRGWGVSVTPRPLFSPRKDPVPLVQEAEWAPGSVWTGAENLAPTGIPSPDRPARSQSLYQLRYRGPQLRIYCHLIYVT